MTNHRKAHKALSGAEDPIEPIMENHIRMNNLRLLNNSNSSFPIRDQRNSFSQRRNNLIMIPPHVQNVYILAYGENGIHLPLS